MNTEIPLAKQRTRPFYGWVIVAVMAAIGAFMPALATLNYGLFIKPMGDELGIGRSIFGWAMTARQITASATGPILGRLLDRFGSRVLLAVAAIVTGAAMFALGFMSQSWQLIAFFGVMGLIGLGGPGGSMVTSVPIFKWFVENRGRAIAFSSLGVPVGAIIFIPLTQTLIDSRGWREAWIILAIISVVIIVPIALALVRRQPEDMGLLPDGAAQSPETGHHHTAAAGKIGEVSWTVKEAVRSPVFWRLVAVFSLVFLGLSSIGVHRIPAFMDRGLDPTLIAYATAFDAILAGASTFISGLLVKRLPAKVIGTASLCLLGVAGVLTTIAYSFPVMFLSMAVFGFGIGGMGFAASFLWAEDFGREHLGSILGVVTPITMLVGGIGAPLAGYVRDLTGRYDPIWWVSVGVILLCAGTLATTGAPQKTVSVSPVPQR